MCILINTCSINIFERILDWKIREGMRAKALEVVKENLKNWVSTQALKIEQDTNGWETKGGIKRLGCL